MRTKIISKDNVFVARQWECATNYMTDDGYPETRGADCVILEKDGKSYALPNLKFQEGGYEDDEYYYPFYRATYDADEMLDKIMKIGSVDLTKWVEIEEDNRTLEDKWDDYAQEEMEERAYWMGR